MHDAYFKANPKAKTMSKEQLETLENEVNAELKQMAVAERSIHDPITDGVVDIDRYLSSSPKMLWILKEPWEDLEDGEGGGGWSVTKDLVAKGQFGDRGTYASMAYVTYSVFNNYTNYSDIPYVTKDSKVGESLKNIAYINVNKFPGKRTSSPANVEFYYRRNRNVLKRQIDTINPDIVIGGNTLHLFFDDFGLKSDEFKSEGSASFCCQDGRLYIWAYHPAQWSVKKCAYVDDIVTVIKKNRQGSTTHCD
jgi:hypothetical protein